MIIDAHAHIFPDKIADKAAAGIGAFYDLKIRHDGRLSTLLRIEEEAGVDRFIVQSVATVPEQVESINNFIAASVSEYPDKLVGFGALHPDYAEIEKETERIVSLGLKGIKLHSDFQKFDIDDPNAYKIYETAEKMKLPILFHVGDFRYEYSDPDRLAKVMELYPDLTIIGAHFAGWSEWDKAEKLFAGGKIYCDLSSSLYAMTPERAGELIHTLGVERVMFGTDYPMWTPKEELEKFDKIPLTKEERELILYKNALRLIGEGE